MLNLLAAVGIAASLLTPISGPWDDDDTPPVDPITITVATVNGTGCRPGSAEIAVANDHTAFTVTYSEYLAQVGVGAKPTDFRKNCQLSLKVHVPQGFTYAIASADYRGYGKLEKGASAQQVAGYYFQGSSDTGRSTHNFRNTDGNWQATDRVAVDALVFAPCGVERNFNINTELRVSAGTSDVKHTTSVFMMDSTDVAINTEYQFQWRRCH